MNNVPDDWALYYVKCPECKTTYHLSENFCDRCYEEEKEDDKD